MALTASILPVGSMSIMFALNTISIMYGSHSIPTTAIISLILLWLFVAVSTYYEVFLPLIRIIF